MNVTDALRRRHSTRAFLDRPVPEADLRHVLEVASRAPSGTNTQPWRVEVARGATLVGVLGAIEAAYRAGEPAHPDYRYYPSRWVEPFAARRIACGRQLYGALGIRRDDRERRREQWIANYRSFGAPVVAFVHIAAGLEAGSYMDAGMFIQSLMLAACERGLSSCPQAALAEYPHIVRTGLGLGNDRVIVCGIAIGYEDTAAAVNGYRTPREPVDGFARFHD